MRAFFDTNVVVYALEPLASAKQAQAQALMARHAADRTLVVSTQVLMEAFNALVRKRDVPTASALAAVDLLATREVQPANADFVRRAIALAVQQQLSHWDGAIVQAALDARCDVLYTEDLNAGQRFGALEVVNPFAASAHEAAPAWPAAGTPSARAGTRRRGTARA